MHLHDMSEEIETKVRQAFPGHAIVHVDPLNTAHEHYDEVHRIVTEAVAAEKKIVSFHDLRLVGGKNRFKVVFDVAPAPGAKDIPIESFRERSGARIRTKFPRATIAIDLEPPYFHNDPIIRSVHREGVRPPGTARRGSSESLRGTRIQPWHSRENSTWSAWVAARWIRSASTRADRRRPEDAGHGNHAARRRACGHRPRRGRAARRHGAVHRQARRRRPRAVHHPGIQARGSGHQLHPHHAEDVGDPRHRRHQPGQGHPHALLLHR